MIAFTMADAFIVQVNIIFPVWRIGRNIKNLVFVEQNWGNFKIFLELLNYEAENSCLST